MKRIPYPAKALERALHLDAKRYTPVTDTQLVLELISQVVAAKSDAVICEIGCNEGMTTLEIARAFPDATIIGIDHPGAATICEKQLEERPLAERFCENACSLPNVIPIYKDMASMPDIPGGIDVAFIDGDHTKEGCLRDTEWAVRNGAELIVWHDYYEGPPAWLPAWVGVNAVVEQYEGTSVSGSGVAFLLLPRAG